MLNPFYQMGEIIRSRFDIPSDVRRAAEHFSNDVNGYVERVATVSSLPVAATIGLIGIGKILFYINFMKIKFNFLTIIILDL